jgi:hypothetical protein
MQNNQTISGTGSALMGAGLVMIQGNLNTGLILIGVGVILNILVAILQKKGLDVQSAPLG